jgi:tetratricopeptide (TPR) repeat protein
LISIHKSEIILRFAISVVENAVSNAGSPEDQVRTGLLAIFIIILIPVLIALFFLIRFTYRNTLGIWRKTTIIEDYKKEAEGYEKAGKFVSAANVLESKLKDYKKAAVLYEKGGDYRRAASLYELMGMTGKAKEMHENDGNIAAAAEVSFSEGEYEDAARLYDKAGKKVDAAAVLERSGRRLAAVRIYREAGEYRKASILLEEEGMLKEAAEMFGFSLHGKKTDSSNLEDFYSYAFKLEKAGEQGKAIEVYLEIDRISPAFRDVHERLQALTTSPQEKEDLEGKTTLRGFFLSGKIEPKHSLKFWVQILKSLQEAYSGGRAYGLLSPDNIVFDAQNNITFLSRVTSSAYRAPETTKGVDLDVRADIYSSGVILYEMLTGKLEGLGSERVSDIAEDVPEWLDEIVIKCIKKVKDDRYPSIEDIFTDLKALSMAKKESS